MNLYMDYLIDNRLNGIIVYPNTLQGLEDCFQDDVRKCLENTLYNDKYDKNAPLFIEYNEKVYTIQNFESIVVFAQEDFYNFIKAIIIEGELYVL